jgi:hypothetical protein
MALARSPLLDVVSLGILVSEPMVKVAGRKTFKSRDGLAASAEVVPTKGVHETTFNSIRNEEMMKISPF